MAEAMPFQSIVRTAFFSSNSSFGLPLVLLLQIFREECGGEFPGFGGVSGAVALLVAGILEGMSRVREDVNVHGLAQRFELRFELLYVGNRNTHVLAAEDPEDSGIDLLQRGVVGSEMAVVDDRDLQPRIGNGEIERIAASHAPSDGTDALGIDVGLRA